MARVDGVVQIRVSRTYHINSVISVRSIWGRCVFVDEVGVDIGMHVTRDTL